MFGGKKRRSMRQNKFCGAAYAGKAGAGRQRETTSAVDGGRQHQRDAGGARPDRWRAARRRSGRRLRLRARRNAAASRPKPDSGAALNRRAANATQASRGRRCGGQRSCAATMRHLRPQCVNAPPLAITLMNRVPARARSWRRSGHGLFLCVGNFLRRIGGNMNNAARRRTGVAGGFGRQPAQIIAKITPGVVRADDRHARGARCGQKAAPSAPAKRAPADRPARSSGGDARRRPRRATATRCCARVSRCGSSCARGASPNINSASGLWLREQLRQIAVDRRIAGREKHARRLSRLPEPAAAGRARRSHQRPGRIERRARKRPEAGDEDGDSHHTPSNCAISSTASVGASLPAATAASACLGPCRARPGRCAAAR